MKVEIKGIFVKSLLIILAVSFVLFGIINFFSGVGVNNVVKIADQNVSLMQFSRYLTEKRNQFFSADISKKDLDYLNSKDFVMESLREYIYDIVIQTKVNDLGLKEPREAAAREVTQNPNFKDSNGKFSIELFKDILNKNRLSEDAYIDFISMYSSKNNLMQLIASQNFSNDFITDKLFKNGNKYVVADIIEIKPESLTFEYKKPTDEEMSKYYESNKNSFIVPEERVISFVDIDLSGYTAEEGKAKLSNLEDLVLSSNNLDEIAKTYNVKKNEISYQKGKEMPEDLNIDMLQYNAGTFSDVIYKDNNMYKVYYVEKVIPSKLLTLDEAKEQISKILIDNARKDNELIAIDKIVRQMRTNNIDMVAYRNGFVVLNNKTIYRNDINYSEAFIRDLFKTKEINSFTKPVFDSEKKVYLLGLLKDVKEVPADSSNFVKYDLTESIVNRSYSNSVYRMFEKYLFDNTKIVINNKLLNTIE